MFALLQPRAAQAEEPATGRVVLVRTEGFSDDRELRAALEKELETALGTSGDERATGELDVRFDSAAQKLVVRYRSFGELLTREVKAGPSEAEVRRAAAVLAGSLTRGGPETATRPVAPESPPTPTPSPARLAAPADEEARRYHALVSMIEVRNESDRRALAENIVTTVAGVGVTTASFLMPGHDDANRVLLGAGVAMTVGGVGGFVVRSPYGVALKSVRDAGASGGLPAAEEALAEAASSERRMRKIGGGIMMGLGAAVAGIGVGVLAKAPAEDQREDRGRAVAALAGGTIYGLIGVYLFARPGSLEQTHEAYERVFKRPQVSLRPNLSVSATGGAVGVTGTF